MSIRNNRRTAGFVIQPRIAATLCAIVSALGLLSCGGGGNSDAPKSTPTPQPAPGPTASCPTNASQAAAQQQFSQRPAEAPIAQLIVKLRSPASTASNLRATAANRLRAAVIQRVVSRWQAATTQHQDLAAQARRILSDGAIVVALQQPLSSSDASELARYFSSDPDIEYAEIDQRVFAQRIPNDTDYPQQWNLSNPNGGINLPAAWDFTTGAANIVVAVLDTGYRPHADLTGNLLPGYDFITDIASANDNDGRDPDASDPGDWLTQQELSTPGSPLRGCDDAPADSSWHGTHVAGIIGAAGNNGMGIAGASWTGKILPVRVLGKCGGTSSDVAEGMRWAAGMQIDGVPLNPNPAKVINLSLLGGTGACSRTFQQAIHDVTSLGVSVVVAAGNSNKVVTNANPANCAGVISVAANDQSGQKAWFSNYGAAVTISAPGSRILSTYNTGTTIPGSDSYHELSGTSMAAPHVAGVIALMLAVNPNLTPPEILQKLQQTARPFPAKANAPSCPVLPYGAGIVDASAAVQAALAH